MSEDPPEPASHDETKAAPAGGRTFGRGRFTVIRALGQGGMGSVWLAHDASLNESVALKFLPAALTGDAGAIANLRRETANSRRLTHPHILRIHDLHEHPGEEPFLAMEFVDGQTVGEWRAAQPDGIVPWDRLAPLARQLCAALAHAHAEKVVHRDLKPANLMLDRAGRLKLADLGIAAVVSETMSRVTGTASSGTAAYMSPQQVNGDMAKPTDDLYSVGATLYELLTGRPPFFAGEILHQVLHKPAPLLRERLAELKLNNPVPDAVARAILACLEKEPAKRPQSAADLARQLGLGEVNDATNFAATPARAVKRQLALAAALVVAAFLLWLATRPDVDSGTKTPVAKRPAISVPAFATNAQAVSASPPVAPVAAAKTPVVAVPLIFAEDFEDLSADGLPRQWDRQVIERSRERAAFFGIKQEEGNHFFRMTLTDAGTKTLQIYRLAPLNTHTNGHLDYSIRLRGQDLKIISTTGKLCGISLSFFDAAGRHVSSGPPLDVGRAAAWTRLSARVAIPPRATAVRIHLELRGATGTLDFDDLRAVIAE